MNTTTLNMTTLDGGVIIKKGGGGGSTPPSGGGSNVEYWDITGAPEGVYEVAGYATLLKYIKSESKQIYSIYTLRTSNITPIAVAIDMNLKMVRGDGAVKTVGEIFKDLGFPSFDTLGWKQITKEQFYSLD